jgi:hypothetical protein
MYKNINLLNTYSKDLVDFARKTLKILFSSEELKNHTLPPEREYLRRRALDPKRFDMMIGKPLLSSSTSFISILFYIIFRSYTN